VCLRTDPIRAAGSVWRWSRGPGRGENECRSGVFPPSASRWPFLAAVALIASAVSDLLVEAIANTGVFGRAFYDTDDAGIVPSLIAAMLLAGSVIGGHARAACRRSPGRRDRLANVAADLAAHAPLRDVPYILVLQVAALFAMESVEQLVAGGHLAGGLMWLGGPPLIAAAAHVAIGLLCTLGAGWLMRVSVPHFASLVCSALGLVLCARALKGGAVFVVRRDPASCNAAQSACVRRISGRAPPFLPAPA
jgi:hypothetical protein